MKTWGVSGLCCQALLIALLQTACASEKKTRVVVERFAENPILDGSFSETLGFQFPFALDDSIGGGRIIL